MVSEHCLAQDMLCSSLSPFGSCGLLLLLNVISAEAQTCPRPLLGGWSQVKSRNTPSFHVGDVSRPTSQLVIVEGKGDFEGSRFCHKYIASMRCTLPSSICCSDHLSAPDVRRANEGLGPRRFSDCLFPSEDFAPHFDCCQRKPDTSVSGDFVRFRQPGHSNIEDVSLMQVSPPALDMIGAFLRGASGSFGQIEILAWFHSRVHIGRLRSDVVRAPYNQASPAGPFVRGLWQRLLGPEEAYVFPVRPTPLLPAALTPHLIVTNVRGVDLFPLLFDYRDGNSVTRGTFIVVATQFPMISALFDSIRPGHDCIWGATCTIETDTLAAPCIYTWDSLIPLFEGIYIRMNEIPHEVPRQPVVMPDSTCSGAPEADADSDDSAYDPDDWSCDQDSDDTTFMQHPPEEDWTVHPDALSALEVAASWHNERLYI